MTLIVLYPKLFPKTDPEPARAGCLRRENRDLLLRKDDTMKVFTTGQIAKICKVAPRTVSKWFDSGRLKGYRIPGSQDRRIPREYLIKFLKEHGMPLGDLEDEAMAKVLIVAQDQVMIENLRRELPLERSFKVAVATNDFDAGKLNGYRIPGKQNRRIPRVYLIQFMRKHGIALGELEKVTQIRILLVTRDADLSTVLHAAMPAELSYNLAQAANYAVAREIARNFCADVAIVDFALAPEEARGCCDALRHCQPDRTMCVFSILPEGAERTICGLKVDAVYWKPIHSATTAAMATAIRELVQDHKELDC
ncbi:MAG: helix-turn-helix domain-containing protein [Candidatus Peribacteraceae bacterium]|nr:helix-turn-helix domain-containing protein [Candidatus Peribacteraceae bacterium]